jgi:hypothetical protein
VIEDLLSRAETGMGMGDTAHDADSFGDLVGDIVSIVLEVSALLI